MLVVAKSGSSLLPFVVFGAFMLLFATQARRRGERVSDYLWERNRTIFRNLKPGWWKPAVAFAAVMWTVLFVVSGFKLVLLAALPLVLLWLPFWGHVFRAYFRRH